MSASIHPGTFKFLKNLKNNNNREWFNENKHLYTAAQENVLTFVTELLEKMADFDPEMEKIDPKKTLFRIYRDTRFSADKSPYKTNFGASINGIGKKDGGAGYYMHLDPTGCFLASGVYMVEAPKLKKLRQHISENAGDLNKIIDAKNFKKFSFNNEKLSRVPQGFEKDDPMAEFLKMKHLAISKNLTEKDFTDKNALNKVYETFKDSADFVNFLNEPLR